MIKYVVLAIVQGLTEFLPVSSSGHLVIFNKILSSQANLFFYADVHLGTTLALVVFFAKDIVKALRDVDILKKIGLVTLITATLGFLGRDMFRSLFYNYKLVFVALFVNGLVLLFANRKINAAEKSKPSYLDSLIFFLILN